MASVAEALRAVGTGGSFTGKLGVTVRWVEAYDGLVGVTGLVAVAEDAGFAVVLVVAVDARGVLFTNAAEAGDEEKAR